MNNADNVKQTVEMETSMGNVAEQGGMNGAFEGAEVTGGVYHDTAPSEIEPQSDDAQYSEIGADEEAEAAGSDEHDIPPSELGAPCAETEEDENKQTQDGASEHGPVKADVTYEEIFGGSSQALSAPVPESLKWMESLEMNKKGDMEQSRYNCELIFMNDPELDKLFGMNTFTEKTELLKETPWDRPLSNPVVRESGKSLLWQPDSSEPEFTNTDLLELYAYMSRTHGFEKEKIIDECVTMFAKRNSFHPVRQYLDGLSWDGKPRIDTLLSDYFGIEQTEYLRAVMRKTLIAAVKRVSEPGCQFDSVLTLYGPQGCGKSSFWNNLAGRWYSDLPVSIGTKDALQSFQGAWLIELGELAALNSTSVEKYKAVITRKEDRYRRHYEKLIESHPRQCIFVGTTNRPDFLKDMTGNRRFWVVDVTSKQTPKKSVWVNLPREADQIWAEAKALYDKDNEPLFLDGALAKEAEQLQNSFMTYDPMRDAIELYLARSLPQNWGNMTPEQHVVWLKDSDNIGTAKRTHVCLKEIIKEALGEIVTNPNKKVLNEIAAIVSTITYDNGERWHKPEHQRQARIPGYGKQRIFERY